MVGLSARIFISASSVSGRWSVPFGDSGKLCADGLKTGVIAGMDEGCTD